MRVSHIPFLLMAASAALATTSASAQLMQVVVEEFDPATLNPDWTPIGEASNLTTYRIYAEMASPNDAVIELTSQQVVVAQGVVENCLDTYITTTTSWYNDAIYGNALGSAVSASFMPFFATLAGDSWLTIGMESASLPPGGSLFDIGYSGLNASFQAANGVNFFGFDGSIFALPGSPNTLPTGPNNRVLLGQLTTDGAIAFGINISVQISGVPGTPFHIYTHESCGIPQNEALGLTYVPAADLGCLYAQEGATIYACTDPLACNYNPLATISSPVCDYDGCDGCTDTEACNYWDEAIFDNGSCCYDNCLNLSIVENLPVSYFELYDANGELLVTVYNGLCFDNCANGNIPEGVDVNSACFQWLSAEIPQCCTTPFWDWQGECQSFYDECVASGANIAVNCDLYTGSPAPQVLCLADGDYTIVYFGLDWEIWNDDFNFDSNGVSSGQGFNIEALLAGCTDQDACNYNADADIDNGTCTYVELFEIQGEPAFTVFSELTYTYPGQEGSSFEWAVTPGLTIIEGQGTPSVLVAGPVIGESTICVIETLADGCIGGAVCKEIEVQTSIGEYTVIPPKVFPNPAVNSVTIDSGDRAWSWVIVRDALGREVGTHQLQGRSILDVSGLSAGRYHLEFHGGDGTAVVPLLVVR